MYICTCIHKMEATDVSPGCDVQSRCRQHLVSREMNLFCRYAPPQAPQGQMAQQPQPQLGQMRPGTGSLQLGHRSGESASVRRRFQLGHAKTKPFQPCLPRAPVWVSSLEVGIPCPWHSTTTEALLMVYHLLHKATQGRQICRSDLRMRKDLATILCLGR